MTRSTIAFLTAPLAVPLLLLPLLLFVHLAPGWILAATIIAALVSYTGTLILGIPIYMALRACGLTHVWIAGVVGFAIGAAMWLVFSVLFVLSLGQGMAGVQLALTDMQSLTGILWGGVLGMIVGVLFWLIARPDKQAV